MAMARGIRAVMVSSVITFFALLARDLHLF